MLFRMEHNECFGAEMTKGILNANIIRYMMTEDKVLTL